MHQKRSIPCQECPILLYHCGEQALIVGIILVAALGIVLTELARYIEKRFDPWRVYMAER